MAHIETRYRCPICRGGFYSLSEAMSCRNHHPVEIERWAVGIDGKAVRIFDNRAPNSMGGESYALREADLSDLIDERKKQLEKERNHAE